MADIQNNNASQIDRDHLIDILTDELPVLRTKIGVKQAKLSDIFGINRQTYSAIETKKKNDVEYFSLLMFFTQNENTAPVIEGIGAFPSELKAVININNRK